MSEAKQVGHGACAGLDLSHAPPFSAVYDPVLIAAQEMLRELRR